MIDREDVRRLASAVASGEIDFSQGQLLDDFIAKCVAFTGMPAIVAETIALRAMMCPDAFPVTLPLLRERSQKWRPWRAYALLHLSLTGQAHGRQGQLSVSPDSPSRAMNRRARHRGRRIMRRC